MNPPLQGFRLSKIEVDILNSIKRKTRINQWNILCRMAFCLSCQDPTLPPALKHSSADGNVELEWDTFGGHYAEVFIALLAFHKINNNNKSGNSEYFRRLLFRGIARLKDNLQHNI